MNEDYEVMENLKKRYWVFREPEEDCSGGLSDIEETFDTIAEAKTFVDERGLDFNEWKVFDSKELRYVKI